MKNILQSITLLFSIFTFAQAKDVENGNYISQSKKYRVKLTLSDDKNYNISFRSGKYEIKNDSIILSNPDAKKSSFDLKYKFDLYNKSDKIVINLTTNNTYLDNIYFAAFNKNETPRYKRAIQMLPESSKADAEYQYLKKVTFEINRVDFLTLALENYNLETELTTFKLPDNLSIIDIEELDNNNSSINLSGVYNKKNKELTVFTNRQDPIILVLEDPKNAIEQPAEIFPIEQKKLANWNYPGKTEIVPNTDVPNTTTEEIVVDNTATKVETRKFDLKTEKNLTEALKANEKTFKKFLVIYYDPKNDNAQAEFNNFIYYQNDEIAYNVHNGYNEMYDKYNYYFASKKDEKWLKNYKIKDFPCLVVLNSEGEILSQANKKLFDLQNQFDYFSDFSKKIARINSLKDFNKIISKKDASDKDLIKAFLTVSFLEMPYEYTYQSEELANLAPISIIPIEPLKDEEKTVEIESTKIHPEIKTIEDLPPPVVEETIDSNVYTKVDFDKNQLDVTWT